MSLNGDAIISDFKKVSEYYQTIKADRMKLNSLLPLVEIYEKVIYNFI